MRLIAAIVAPVLVLASAGLAQGPPPPGHVATVDRSALLALTGDGGPAPRFLDLTVEAYTPSTQGPVQIVVLADDHGQAVEVGRFGLSGRRAFDGAAGDAVQRFSLPLPPGFDARRDRLIEIRVTPLAGSASGARVELGDPHLRS